MTGRPWRQRLRENADRLRDCPLEPLAERLTARGEVVLVVPFQERRLETEELHYDPELNQLWSDSAFVMNEEGRERAGSSFRSDLEFRDFVVQGSGGTGP